ncbi:hypothetical protein BJV74DRAFT_283041 [Russula compacta]|nr:hypothetical protein BJV74DRAFT_283041 [Russula compacta]
MYKPYPPAASAVPTCRYPNCYRPVTRDERTLELSEYCSLEHMRDAVQHLGFPLCPACNRCPRRTDSKFLQGELLQLGQQQKHQQRYQERQHWQSLTMGPPEMVRNVNAVASSNATRGSVPYPHGSWYSWRYQQ